MAGYTPRGGRRLCCCDNVTPTAPRGFFAVGASVCQMPDAAFVEQSDRRVFLAAGVALLVVRYVGHGTGGGTWTLRVDLKTATVQATAGEVERLDETTAGRYVS